MTKDKEFIKKFNKDWRRKFYSDEGKKESLKGFE